MRNKKKIISLKQIKREKSDDLKLETVYFRVFFQNIFLIIKNIFKFYKE